jgi:phosphatidylserine decarboxylase
MAKTLHDWLEADVRPYRDKPIRWLGEQHFFRDPARAGHADPSYFFSPADGLLIYQKTVRADEPLVALKGRHYSLRDAMRDPGFDSPCLVIGIFMTFFDVHVNRVPYPGLLSFRELDPIDTYNHPMLDVEKYILDELRIPANALEYLHHNQRVLNRVWADDLGQHYYILQIADYDVDCVTPFDLKQNQPVGQGQRFSQVRYGSQVDLVVPLSARFDFTALQPTGVHVEAGVDPLIKVTPKRIQRKPLS